MKHWRERFPEIYAEEREYWLGKDFKELVSPRGETSFAGTLLVRRRGRKGLETRDFELQFDYPPGYPFQIPSVTFIRPRVEGGRHQSPDGHPCLFPASAWDKNVRASELYAATERWLNHHLDGHFPRELALYELPEYFDRTAYAVLVPPQALQSFAGQDRGGFSLSELIGQDLCALRSIDGDGVGHGLISELAPKRLWKELKPAKWYRLEREPRGMHHTKELEAVLVASGYQSPSSNDPASAAICSALSSQMRCWAENVCS